MSKFIHELDAARIARHFLADNTILLPMRLIEDLCHYQKNAAEVIRSTRLDAIGRIWSYINSVCNSDQLSRFQGFQRAKHLTEIPSSRLESIHQYKLSDEIKPFLYEHGHILWDKTYVNPISAEVYDLEIEYQSYRSVIDSPLGIWHCSKTTEYLPFTTDNDAASLELADNLQHFSIEEKTAHKCIVDYIQNYLESDHQKHFSSRLVPFWKRNGKQSKWDYTARDLFTSIAPLKQIKYQTGHIFRGDVAGRCFNPLTQMGRVLRKAIRIDGETCSNVDMVSAQVNLTAHLCGDQRLQKDCQAGILYEKMMDYLHLTREEAKELFFWYSYGKNRLARQYPDAPDIWSFMECYYPTTSDFIWAEKSRRPYKEWAAKIQSFEAHHFIDGIFRMLNNKNIITCPIHDSIYCKQSDTEHIRDITMKYFQQHNITCNMKIE